MTYRGPHVAVLDVGHGNCAVIRDEQGTVVVDTGPGGTLLEYLEDEGIYEIDLVVLSHADQDHIGGLVGLLSSQTVKVKEIRLNSDALKTSALWDDLRYELDRLDAVGEIAFHVSLTRGAGSSFTRGRCTIEVAGPGKYLASAGPGGHDRNGKRLTSNSISAVIRVVYDGAPVVLFTGDMDAIGLGDIVENDVDIVAPVVVFPHHGGSVGTSRGNAFVDSLLDITLAKTVLFSFGRVGRGSKKPLPSITSRVVARGGVRVACTQLSEHCGATHSVKPSHLLPIVARGKSESHCCGGTFVVPLDAPGTVLPTAASHGEFIQLSAPTRLC